MRAEAVWNFLIDWVKRQVVAGLSLSFRISLLLRIALIDSHQQQSYVKDKCKCTKDMSEAQWGEGCGHYFMRYTWLEALRLETSPNTISSVFSVNVLISGKISSKTTGGKGGKNDSNARGQAGTITTINSEIVTNYGVKSRTIHFTTGSVGVHDNVI